MPMVHSSDDMLAFVAELNVRRIKMVLAKRYRRKHGQPLLVMPNGSVPIDIDERVTGWLAVARKLHNRYLRDQYLHDDNEISAVRDLAYWLLEEHRLNEQLTTPTQWRFDATNMQCQTPPPHGRYAEYVQKVYCD